jgi:histidinol-phosphate aminotransferase
MKRTPWNKPNQHSNKLNLSNNVCHDSILIDDVKKLFANLDIDPSQYPDEYKAYRAISDYHNVKIENIAIGHGSGELMNRLLYIFKEKKISIISPTWQIPEVMSAIIGMNYVTGYDQTADVVYVANPNGQTGSKINGLESLSQLHEWVIVDEAYMDFCDQKSLCTNRPDNVIILKSLSKSLSMAGLRFGYLIGNEAIVDHIQQIRPNYVTNIFVTEALPELLQMIPGHVNRMIETRNYIESNYDCLKSNANYVLFKNPPAFISKWKTKRIKNLTRMSLLNLKDFIDASS